MRPILFLLILGALAALAFLVGDQLFGGAVAWSGSKTTEAPTSALSANRTADQTRSSNGIDVTVDRVRRSDAETIVTLLLNNHQIDLSAFDLSTRSTLGDVSAVRYVILENGGGGHHVTSELIFPADATGVLAVALDEQRVFTFDEPL